MMDQTFECRRCGRALAMARLIHFLSPDPGNTIKRYSGSAFNKRESAALC